MGPNWALLNDYSEFIIMIFLLYFFIQVTNSTLLALSQEKKLLLVDRIILSVRFLSYIIMLILSSNFGFLLSIYSILYVEVFIRIVNLLFQLLLFVQLKPWLKKEF